MEIRASFFYLPKIWTTQIISTFSLCKLAKFFSYNLQTLTKNDILANSFHTVQDMNSWLTRLYCTRDTKSISEFYTRTSSAAIPTIRISMHRQNLYLKMQQGSVLFAGKPTKLCQVMWNEPNICFRASMGLWLWMRRVVNRILTWQSGFLRRAWRLTKQKAKRNYSPSKWTLRRNMQTWSSQYMSILSGVSLI